jgi:hypothetical protein
MGFTSGGYTTQRGLGRAQFGKLETVASRWSNCDHFYGNRFCLRVAVNQEPIIRVVLAIGGVFTPMLAKHTKHLSLVDILSVGVDRTQRAREFPLLLDDIHRSIRWAKVRHLDADSF